MEFARLGLKGLFSDGKTGVAVYPRVMKHLLTWTKPKAKDVRELFEQLGVTYIKFGQFIASSPSLFPDEYVREFQSCLDQTTPLPYASIERVLREELGDKVDTEFEWIDQQPLASASIAQVHAARTRSGDDVVIKVQRQDVKDIVQIDLNVVFVVTRLFELIMPTLEKSMLTDLVDEMYQAMIDECDFVKEADNLEEFQAFVSAAQHEKVIAPRPLRQLCSARVLTMTRVYGVSLTAPEVQDQRREQATEALLVGLMAWFGSLTQCQAFHADLHSGNLLLLEDGKIAFIDFGMVGRVDPQIWRSSVDLFSGLSDENAAKIAQAMASIGMTRQSVDVPELTRDIERLLNSWGSEQGFEHVLQSGGVDKLIAELGGIARRHGIRFPRAFTLLLKQLLYFDSYWALLSPGNHLFDEIGSGWAELMSP